VLLNTLTLAMTCTHQHQAALPFFGVSSFVFHRLLSFIGFVLLFLIIYYLLFIYLCIYLFIYLFIIIYLLFFCGDSMPLLTLCTVGSLLSVGATQKAVWTSVLLNTLTLAMTCSTYFQLCGNGGVREGPLGSSFLHQASTGFMPRCISWGAVIMVE
jgi:hypothetical protein